ncbi:MAG: hypothetical protein ABIA04_14305 [Pseudomonadota bacterium]
MKIKIIYIILISILILFTANISYAQFSLGLETGANMPIEKDDSTTSAKRYDWSYYLSPVIEIPIFSFAYTVSLFPIYPTIDVHTFDFAVRQEFGNHGLRPYFKGGAGYALFNTENKYLSGGHLFGYFGINYVIEKYKLAIGPAVKYNLIMYNADETFQTGESFAMYQYISFLVFFAYVF